MFKFCEKLFDWIEIWAIWGQKSDGSPDGMNELLHARCFESSEIIENDYVSWAKSRAKNFIDVEEEAVAIHSAIE